MWTRQLEHNMQCPKINGKPHDFDFHHSIVDEVPLIAVCTTTYDSKHKPMEPQ